MMPTNFEVFGNSLELPKRTNEAISVFKDGVYEKDTTNVFLGEIKSGMTVVDIGAHVGYYTLLAAKLVGDGGRVFAFEPAPANFSILASNAEKNGYSNISLIQKAVSGKSSRLKLFLQDYKYSGKHAFGQDSKAAGHILVDSVSLDEFFKDLDGRIDFIKMDIEGAELIALEGMSRVLGENRNIKLVFEFSPIQLRRVGSSPDKLFHLLMGLGFNIYEYNGGDKKIVDLNRTKALIGELEDGKQGYGERSIYINLFCQR